MKMQAMKYIIFEKYFINAEKIRESFERTLNTTHWKFEFNNNRTWVILANRSHNSLPNQKIIKTYRQYSDLIKHLKYYIFKLHHQTCQGY